jgi:predicted MarR family transcription regulator
MDARSLPAYLRDVAIPHGGTPMADSFAANYWQIRSAEVVSIADIADDEDDRHDLLRIAAIFDGMAERARRRAEE